MKTILKVDSIEKYYGNKSNITKALDNISFEVNKGEFVGIMGPSGSWKDHVAQLYIHHRHRYQWTYIHQRKGHNQT